MEIKNIHLFDLFPITFSSNWRIFKNWNFSYFRFTISGRTWKNAFGTEQGIRKYYQSASIDRRGTSTRDRGNFFFFRNIFFSRLFFVWIEI